MKKKPTSYLMTWFLAVCFIFATTSLQAQNKKEERQVSGFSEISISVSADVYLSQGDEEKLVLEGDEDALEEIETEVRGDELKIKYKGTFHFGNIDKVKIYLTAKDISEINIAGSAKLEAKTKITASNLDFAVSGSGKIRIKDLETNEINASISGSGDIVLGGSKKAEELDISISGSGDLDSEELEIGSAEISVSGSGGCKVFVTEELDVSISGSGRVYYKGSPVVNAKVSGSGKVKTMD